MSEIQGWRSPDSTRAFKPQRGDSQVIKDGQRAVPVNSCDGTRPLTISDLDRTDLTGTRIGNYLLGEKIGSGGMGQVFVGTHEKLNKRFALKFMASSARESDEGARRFQQEVESLGSLSHPNIVSAVDAGCSHCVQFLVTEMIAGQDLWHLVAETGPLNEERAGEVLRQVAAGLSFAHSKGFVHRDIKPSNLIVDEHGVVRILDFGLVRKLQQSQDVTTPGLLMGTIDFLAPEQAADGRMADCRSDLYSLGCTLLFLLTGRVPFGGEQFDKIPAKIHGHLFFEPSALSSGELQISTRMLTVLRKLLQKRPEDRFQSAEELLQFVNDGAVEAGQVEIASVWSVVLNASKRWTRRSRLISSTTAGLILVAAVASSVGKTTSTESRGEMVPAITTLSANEPMAVVASDVVSKQEHRSLAEEQVGADPDAGVAEKSRLETTTAFHDAESSPLRLPMSGKFLSSPASSNRERNDTGWSSAGIIRSKKGN